MKPYLFLDVDGVLHGARMQYGHERTIKVVERLPREQVHPARRPRHFSSREIVGEQAGQHYSRSEMITLSTHMRISKSLLEDLNTLPLDVLMLTTWLEHDSVHAFFQQGPVPGFSYRTLHFPDRDFEDPLGALPADWKIQQLRTKMHAEPRPFIWIDDVEVLIWGEITDREFPDIPHLLIAPEENVGLTRDDVADIRRFLSVLRPEALISDTAELLRHLVATSDADGAYRQLMQISDDLARISPSPASRVDYSEPVSISPEWDAAIAGIVDWRLVQKGLIAPEWLSRFGRPLAERWEPLPAVYEIPPDAVPEPLLRRNVWIGEGELESV